MSRVAIFNLVGVVIAVALGAPFYWELGPFGSPLTKICEETLKERLRSPSGYKRIEVTERKVPFSFVDYRTAEADPNSSTVESRQLLDREIEQMRQAGVKLTRFIQTIRYDAPNAYGTMIRGIAMCDFISKDGGLSRATRSNVRIDGKTHVEFLIGQLNG